MDAQTRDTLLALFDAKLSRQMLLNLETCTRCGLCTKACHAYASMPLPKYAPAYRAEVVRRIYTKYFTKPGRFLPQLGEAKALDDTAIGELREAAYTCTGCRRCMVYCPFGIDTQQIVSIAKLLLIGAGAEPETLTMLADMSVSKGENIDAIKDGFAAGVKRLEERIPAAWRSMAGPAIPVDAAGADMLYVALAGAHSIVPAATVFNAAGESWTLSFFEAVNFGAFVGDPAKTTIILKRIIDEAERLGVTEVCICECGTAFRVMRQMAGPRAFKVVSLTEVQARYIREGRIRVNKLPGTYTYHDPCQIARNAGIYDEPRFVLRNIVEKYHEMSPDPKYNWCCGGGGGLVALGEDSLDFRLRSAKVKAEQIAATGAQTLVTACENCHTQLSDVNEHYGLGKSVRFLSSLVADALAGP
jgi:Fe-S oxidoreductase